MPVGLHRYPANGLWIRSRPHLGMGQPGIATDSPEGRRAAAANPRHRRQLGKVPVLSLRPGSRLRVEIESRCETPGPRLQLVGYLRDFMVKTRPSLSARGGT